MKKIIFLAIILLATFSCNNNDKKEVELISPVQVYEAINGENSLQLVDVRTVDEYKVSHLKNAQNICITNSNFKAQVASLDKGKPVYVYCKSGGRSAKAAAILKEMGFTKVYDLQGGITSWQEKGLETVN